MGVRLTYTRNLGEYVIQLIIDQSELRIPHVIENRSLEIPEQLRYLADLVEIISDEKEKEGSMLEYLGVEESIYPEDEEIEEEEEIEIEEEPVLDDDSEEDTRIEDEIPPDEEEDFNFEDEILDEEIDDDYKE